MTSACKVTVICCPRLQLVGPETTVMLPNLTSFALQGALARLAASLRHGSIGVGVGVAASARCIQRRRMASTPTMRRDFLLPTSDLLDSIAAVGARELP